MRTSTILRLAGGAFAALAATSCSNGSEQPATSAQETALQTTPSELTLQKHDGAFNKGILPRLPNDPVNHTTATISAVPANGDQNPYGVFFVPAEFPPGGRLHFGDIVVSNFNNAANQQGTGTTVVSIDEKTGQSLFFEDNQAKPETPGFSTALGVLKRGFVLVGNVPSVGPTTGTCNQLSDVGQGALSVIDRFGRRIEKITDPDFLDGPWDLAVNDEGDFAQVFVSNVLNGTVSRLDLDVDERGVFVKKMTRIASGYPFRCDSGAFVVGPTGLALDRQREILYVASTVDNAIFAVQDATDTRVDRGPGEIVIQNRHILRGPLGLVRAKDGDLIFANGDAINPNPHFPSEYVEFTPENKPVDLFSVSPNQGSAFGLALEERGDAFRFAVVNDDPASNTLLIWDVR